MHKPINGWTKQGIIDHIEKEFKGKSFDPEQDTCFYRGPNNTKCAVGLFIPDDKYNVMF